MNQDLQCPVCLEEFNGKDVIPKIITVCGHSICAMCLRSYSNSQIISNCPLCKTSMGSMNYNNLPVNYALKNVAENNLLKQTEAVNFTKNCSVHGMKKEFRCCTCEEWICSTCGMLDHRNCQTKPAVEAIRDTILSLRSQVNCTIATFKNCDESKGLTAQDDTFATDVQNRQELIQKLKSLTEKEEQGMMRLKENYQKLVEGKNLALEVIGILEKASYELTKLDSISFSDLLDIEHTIENNIKLLMEIMSNNEKYVEDLPTGKKSQSEQQDEFKRKVLLESMEANKKTIMVKCVTDSASPPVLLEVEVKESVLHTSCSLKYCPTVPSIEVTELLLAAMSTRVCFTLFSGTKYAIGDVIVQKSTHAKDPLVDVCLGQMTDPTEKMKLLWSYDGWLSSCVVQLPYMKLPQELKIAENKKWKAGEVTLASFIDKKVGTKFRISFCIRPETQFEHDRIPLGKVVEGMDVLTNVFERSRNGESILIEKVSLVIQT